MKRLKKVVAAIAMLTLSVSVMGCKMIEKTPEAIQNTAVAKVGNEKVTKGDIDQAMKGTMEQVKQTYGADYASNTEVMAQLKQQKLQVLNQMVNEKLMLQKADELKMKPSDAEIKKKVDENIKKIKDQYSGKGQYEQLLKANGFTEESLKEYQKEQVIVQYVYEQITKTVSVSDDEIKKYYDENKASAYTVGAGANVAHILIADKKSDGKTIDFDASLKKAKEVKAKIDAGADFAKMAKENSADPGSKDNGGSYGFIPYNSTQYVAEFVNGFKSLKESQVSEPVKSQFGYHIIKATGLKKESVTPLDKVKEEIKSQLLQQKQQKAFSAKLEEWKKTIEVKTYEDKL